MAPQFCCSTHNQSGGCSRIISRFSSVSCQFCHICEHGTLIIESFYGERGQMNLNFQAEYFEPPAPCKSAFMELPSTPGTHSYSSYNSVPPNYNPYTAAMRYFHHPSSSQDYSLACNARSSFPMPPVLNHHPLSHHPYLSPPLQAFGSPLESPHDGKPTVEHFLP